MLTTTRHGMGVAHKTWLKSLLQCKTEHFDALSVAGKKAQKMEVGSLGVLEIMVLISAKETAPSYINDVDDDL